MTEYGHGVAEGAGSVSGSNGVGGGGDWGVAVGHMVGDAVGTVSRLPTEQLLLLVVAIIVGFWILKRAL